MTKDYLECVDGRVIEVDLGQTQPHDTPCRHTYEPLTDDFARCIFCGDKCDIDILIRER